MRRNLLVALLLLIVLALAVPMFWPSLIWSTPAVPSAAGSPDAKRGAYLATAGGCSACHTAKGGAALAGGVELKTPYGTFVTPNITPDKDAGIGAWSEADFFRAMRLGLSPGGGHFYPSFPYTAYTNMTDADLRDLWAYLKTVAPVNKKSGGHGLSFPWTFRPGIGLWKLIWFKKGPLVPDASKSAEWNRGAYLVTALLHCAECHTPRNFAGALETDRWMAGGMGSGGKAAPNITPSADGLAKWKPGDYVFFLKSGMLPSGDAVGGEMGPVIDHTSKLSETDIAAIVAYLRALPPLPDKKATATPR